MPLSDYAIVRDIGKGSFGRAILATRKSDGAECILKEIGLSMLSAEERAESKQEVGILAALQHPCIVRYIDSFIERDQILFIAMEYAAGGDLRQRLQSQRNSPLPEKQVLDWFVQICLALKHVHDRKILHRDLKTQNVFLTAAGAVKLGDFGIARVLSGTMECCQTAIGTPYSFSPEICSEQAYNSKSDIWSLGCVLYEMLTFDRPFKGATLQQLVIKILYGKYKRPGPHYSQQTRRLLGSLLKKSPRQRPAVNAILAQPMIVQVVERLLAKGVLPTETIEEEFSHTVLHGEQMQLAWAGMGNRMDGGMGPLLPPEKDASGVGGEGDEDGEYEELDDEADEMEDVDAIALYREEEDEEDNDDDGPTQNNVGATIACDQCVCQENDPSDKNCADPKKSICEVRLSFDGVTRSYNCAEPPDAAACKASVAACSEKTVGIHAYQTCENCVCRGEVGTSCNSKADCLVVNNTEVAYECVQSKCGDKIVDCFDRMNMNAHSEVECDKCVCANAHPTMLCGNDNSCKMTCHDRKGCRSFSNPSLVFACHAEDKDKSDAGEVVGICIAVAAIVALSFALWYYTSVAPRLSRIPSDMLADPLVDSSELVTSGQAGTNVMNTNERAIKGVTQDQYNEL
eukprot:g30.t1